MFDVRPAVDSLDLDFTPERPHAGAAFCYANRSAKLLLSDKTTVDGLRHLEVPSRVAGPMRVDPAYLDFASPLI